MDRKSTTARQWISALSAAASKLGLEQVIKLADGIDWSGMTRPVSASTIRRLLSLSTSDATELARVISTVLNQPTTQARDVGVVLASIAEMRSVGAASKDEVEIVCTAPSRLGVPLRATFPTVLEMIGKANHEILVVGYVFTGGAKKVVEGLAAASSLRNVRVTFIGNRMRQQLKLVRSLWPANSPLPLIYSRECNPKDDMAALHAKLLICDEINGLITSANFSRHGLHENIEIGARISSAAISRLVDFFKAMIREKEVELIELVQGSNW